jgi:hypothetical protein
MAVKISKEGFDAVLRLFDDRRALIAAGKIQRWEVMKWAVTANFTLGAVSAATHQFHLLFIIFAAVIAAIGLALLWHYNLRITQYRHSLASVNTYIRENVIDLNAVGKTVFDRTKDVSHDDREMYLFYGATILSVFPTLLVSLIAT